MKHLLGLRDVSAGEIETILNEAFRMKREVLLGNKKTGDLNGKSVVTLFYENSTRTRLSFELASKYLGATAANITASGSSVAKGETLIDTAKTIRQMAADAVIIRHPSSGAPHLVAEHGDAAVINAGDGGHNHPTQTLTDLLTIRREKGRLSNFTIGFCGDLKFGRTVHSLIKALSRYEGINYILISPEELQIPEYLKKDVFEKKGITFTEVDKMEDVMPQLDILYMTRVQRERFFNEADYVRLKDSYILDMDKLKIAKKDLSILHPLPRVNEISVKVDNDPRACYFKQVLNGKHVRMALIMELLGVSADEH